MKHLEVQYKNNFKQPTYEIGDIFRENRAKLRHLKLSPEQRKVVKAIIRCRTARLGGHKLYCNTCGYSEISYNSCRNRHCPKCQYFKKLKWLNNRIEEILPVKYFHVVFTVPHLLNPLILQNKKELYGLFFKAVNETLTEAALNPKNLGAKIGFMTILHTWGQNLMDHPHIHCVVTGGGLNKDKTKWISSRDNFFIHVKRLSRLFRGKYLYYFKMAYNKKKLGFYGKVEELKYRENFNKLISKLYKKEWVVYSKKPFDNPVNVFKYLGRYTHRIAISNSRIVKVTDKEVSFRWKDYRNGNKKKIMTLPVEEFMRRFLLHTLPKGFKRIRFYGLLSNRYKKDNIKAIRELLNNPDTLMEIKANVPELIIIENDDKAYKCPKCQSTDVTIKELPVDYVIDYYWNTS
jgi:predicted Zn-ribbon and HTH transcriptional regulator